MLAELTQHLWRACAASFQGDEGHDGLPGLCVITAGHGCLGHRRVADQRALDLDRRDAMSGHVHYVIAPAEKPEVAVVVDPRSVTDEVGVLPAIPVSLLVALGVPVDPTKHRRPRLADDEI